MSVASVWGRIVGCYIQTGITAMLDFCIDKNRKAQIVRLNLWNVPRVVFTSVLALLTEVNGRNVLKEKFPQISQCHHKVVLFQTRIIWPCCENKSVLHTKSGWSFISSAFNIKKALYKQSYRIRNKLHMPCLLKNLFLNACLHCKNLTCSLVDKVIFIKNVPTREKMERHWTKPTFVVWKTGSWICLVTQMNAELEQLESD